MSNYPIKYYLDEKNRFVVENYNWAKPFSSFLPGIGGKWGIPLWLYFVNRAQCIASMGVRDKDNAITEFLSFNKACQMVGNQGFRTFVKLKDGKIYEPFKQTREEGIFQRMLISAGQLELNEVNNILGIEVAVEFFPLVNLPVAGLVRKVNIVNDNDESMQLDLIDGLPVLLPFGSNQHSVKFIARHIEAMMKVDFVGGVPLFKLKQEPSDKPQVQKIAGGNFYFTFLPDRKKIQQNNYVVDAEVLFDVSAGYDYPWRFASEGLEKIMVLKQMYENKTPCAFTPLNSTIPGKGSVTFYTVIGNTASTARLSALKKFVIDYGLEMKQEENRKIIEGIQDNMLTISNQKNFDAYCGQTFLDNVMRGGMPVVFKSSKNKSVFYLYSRKHGDLERDYNYFVVEPTYLSQGNGHFRDVNQNRRNDVWFNPGIDDSNIIMFFNLIQTDGYNPLLVNGRTYTADDLKGIENWLGGIVQETKQLKELVAIVERPFTPGEFMMKFEELNTGVEKQDYGYLIGNLLSYCKENEVGDLHVGYWIDHWTYNLDLIDNYLMIYPDRLKELLVDKKIYTFFDNPDIVLPRNRKFVLINGKVRQYDAVIRDKEKLALIKSREKDSCKVRTDYGRREIYKTNLLVKLLSIIANKISSLDPEGIGIEMEADKPGWNDPLNGLPGLNTSSLCETLELKRACTFLLEAIIKIYEDENITLTIYEDLYIFVKNLIGVIDKRLSVKDEGRAFKFWNESHNLKEEYRAKTKFGVSSNESMLKVMEIKHFLTDCIRLIDEIFTGMPRHKVFSENGVCYTYFLNEVNKYEYIYEDETKKKIMINTSGLPLVNPLGFEQKPLSLFLEGPVHFIKVKKKLALEMYNFVKKSRIYDEKLKMFKSSEPIESETFEIGRVKAYSPGWIENESIYLHMEYKFLLELLKAELYEQFFEEVKNVMIPFLKPDVYGRSILENSSFIVSSAFPDAGMHGRGFQPRLTGASAELVNMWLLMVAGPKPFLVNDRQELKFRLDPVLPGWFFTEKAELVKAVGVDGMPIDIEVPANCFVFKLFGKTLAVYHNDKRKNTFGLNKARIVEYILKFADDKIFKAAEETLDGKFAEDIRQGHVTRIDVFFD